MVFSLVMTGANDDLLHEIERSDETGVLRILKIIRQAQDFRSTEDLFRRIVEGVVEIYKAYHHVSIFLRSEDRRLVLCVAQAGQSAEEMQRKFPDGYSQPVDQGITGQVLRTGKMYLCNDVAEDPHFVTMSPGTKSELSIPIFDRTTCVGGLNIESDRVGTFTATDVYLFEVLAHAIGNSMSRDLLAKEALDALGVVGVLGAAHQGAVVTFSPDGELKYGNRRFLAYKSVGGLVDALRGWATGGGLKEGGTFEHTGTRAKAPDTPVTIRARVHTVRGGFVLFEVEEA